MLSLVNNFAIVILIQFAFLVVNAFAVGEESKIINYLKRGIAVGLVFGIIFDLVVGKGLGMFSNKLGFTFQFLVVNGLASYGIMIANIQLLKGRDLIYIYFWSVALAIVYETANYFFPAWEWTFISPVNHLIVVIFAAYFGLTLLMMLALKSLRYIKRAKEELKHFRHKNGSF